MLRFAVLAILPILYLGACATPRQQSEPQQQMPFHAFPMASGRHPSYGSDADLDGEEAYTSSMKGLSVPRRGRVTDAVDLVVRPDVITAEFAIREARPTSPEALSAARLTSADIFARLGKTLGRPVTVKSRGLVANQVVRHGQAVGVVVTVDGMLAIDLPADADFWGRSQLYVSLLEATAAIAKATRTPDQPLRAFSVEDILPAVKEPEAHRAALTERWVAQARAFASLAQAKDSPLTIVDCAPPRAITQVRSSLEEVTLQLAMSCRIDVAGRPSARPPSRPVPGYGE